MENRLIRVEDGTGKVIAKYEYDPFGRRLWKEVDGTKQYFIYCDEGLAGEFDQNGSLIKAYGWKPNSIWTTDPVFMREGESYYYYHNDHLGTPQKLTAQNGLVVWQAKYTAFGEAVIEPASTITNNLRFPGQYQDNETGLHYNYHRYYDPRSGRYLTPDPIGQTGGINLYRFVENNPINKVDAIGLKHWSPGIGIYLPDPWDDVTTPPGWDNPLFPPSPLPGNKGGPNGCGPNDWRAKYVPNTAWGLFDFKPACDNHDNCYAKCGMKKAKCDFNFYMDLTLICSRNPWTYIFLPSGLCQNTALIYFSAVSIFGDSAYAEGQKCCNN